MKTSLDSGDDFRSRRPSITWVLPTTVLLRTTVGTRIYVSIYCQATAKLFILFSFNCTTILKFCFYSMKFAFSREVMYEQLSPPYLKYKWTSRLWWNEIFKQKMFIQFRSCVANLVELIQEKHEWPSVNWNGSVSKWQTVQLTVLWFKW